MKTTDRESVQIGMNVRFPPFCSHTVLEEIAFARSAGFHCVQFAVREPGDYAARLGAVGQALRNAKLAGVMEIIVRIDPAGKNVLG